MTDAVEYVEPEASSTIQLAAIADALSRAENTDKLADEWKWHSGARSPTHTLMHMSPAETEPNRCRYGMSAYTSGGDRLTRGRPHASKALVDERCRGPCAVT